MSSVQTILSNQNASIDIVTDVYQTEQRGAWSLDFIILETLDKNLFFDLQVSNDMNNWFCYKINNLEIDKVNGISIIYDKLPYNYLRLNIFSNATKGKYKVLLNERD